MPLKKLGFSPNVKISFYIKLDFPVRKANQDRNVGVSLRNKIRKPEYWTPEPHLSVILCKRIIDLVINKMFPIPVSQPLLS